MNLLDLILDFLFPTRCFLCRRSAATTFCEECRSRVSPIPSHSCFRCSHPLGRGESGPICRRCRKTKQSYERALSAGLYAGVLRKAILLLKYRGKKRLTEPLSQMMALTWEAKSLPRPDFIVPVPLHPAKLRKRGYNQSELLAKCLGEKFEVAVNSTSLIRCRDTAPQNRLKKEEREKNVRGAFDVLPDSLPRDTRALLVDDVMTTGATMREASLALLKSGIREVYALTAARDILERGDIS
ncbi:MAG: ComF family protein [bacterium]